MSYRNLSNTIAGDKDDCHHGRGKDLGIGMILGENSLNIKLKIYNVHIKIDVT